MSWLGDTNGITTALEPRLRIRLLRREDIAERVAIYSDPRVRNNLAHDGALITRTPWSRHTKSGWTAGSTSV